VTKPPTPSTVRTALVLGTRFALGSRRALARTLLTALGVGLGVSLLLLAASVPQALAERDARSQMRNDLTYGAQDPGPRDDTLLIGDASTFIEGRGVHGRLVEPDGANPPLPPGLSSLPTDGGAIVSPALAEILADPGAGALRSLIPYEIVGLISDEGLLGPDELAFYAGEERLTGTGGGLERRIDHFGDPITREPLDPVLAMLLIVGTIVLILPVFVFIATSTRFGVERRDRRLAALRLVGVDTRTSRSIAATEAVVAALIGVLVGAILFVVGRQLLDVVSVQGISVFPSDVRPGAVLAALVVIAVPLLALVASLLGLRGVIVEPLGVVRTATSTRRRLWWRLLLPAGGLALLLPAVRSLSVGRPPEDVRLLGLGTVLVLSGVLTLLPWVVAALVNRLSAGSLGNRAGVVWQLAVRRLQVAEGTSSRVVSGVAVAAAGIIALQMLFAGLSVNYGRNTGEDPFRADLVATSYGLNADQAAAATAAIATLNRVSNVRTITTASLGAAGKVEIGDCAALAEVAVLGSCTDGEAFLVGTSERIKKFAGRAITLGETGRWTVPASARTVAARTDPSGRKEEDIVLATVGAIDLDGTSRLQVEHYLDDGGGSQERGVAQAAVSAALRKIEPLPVVRALESVGESNPFTDIRTGLTIGGLAVLMTIGLSLMVSGLDQMSERRRVHAALNAVGTPRSVLSWSLLLGSAIPVALGVVLAVVIGTALGALLLAVASTTIRFDLAGVITTAALAAAMVLAVTAAMLPGLGHSMRADGLWSE